MPLAVVDLNGGLGNVLFQYAAALSLQESGRFEVALSDRSGRALSSLQELLEPRIRTASEHEEYRTGFAPAGATDLRRAFARATRAIPTVEERVNRSVAHTAMHDVISNIGSKRIVRLIGYFQHPTWYESVIDSIFKDVSTVHTEVGMRPRTLVVNLRRGDYIYLPWSLTFDFVQRALAQIETLDINEVRIVSDDQFSADAMVQGLAGRFESASVRECARMHSSESRTLRNFLETARAGQVVMSNSTFCWWAVRFGDWLRAREDVGMPRTVVYPQGWFGPASNYDDSIYTPGWVPVQATYYPSL